ncbi:MAG: methionine--tRNA ligase [Proteobacteria bacterium]|nr:methionine--tRNA ligase [Pseudomonadota bacterium]
MNKQRNILVTIALFYANGPIHLGHLVEAIQADVWVRWQRSQGHRCLFLSGSDAHGTSIMISAEQRKISAEQLITEISAEHLRDFEKFFIDFDYFYTTHSPENQALTNLIYKKLKENGDIDTKIISQAYDAEKKLFLADRFIRGQCPRCGAKDQYGDNCAVCGATYEPSELINPVSVFSGTKPVVKESEHFFFNLEKYHNFLQEWVQEHLSPSVANKMQEWLKEPLKEWDITRDAPYFGFEIPDAPGKYFYVWLEAPIGYMACLQKLSQEKSDVNFNQYWQNGTDTELYHFIGKDIVYFHALFWPAMLKGANFRLPTQIHVHGFLTINGEKMSKSRGTFITAADYLKHLNPEYLRYYLSAKLSDQVEDIDLNFEDFCARVNADLVGKFVNLASRCAGFIQKFSQGRLSDALPEPLLYQEFIHAGVAIGNGYEHRQYHRAIRDIMALADRANQYIDHQKPWQLAKEEKFEQVQAICTQGLNLFKVLATYLQPVLPETAIKVAQFFQIDGLYWSDLPTPLLNHVIAPFQPLMQRIKVEDIPLQ